MNKAIVIDPCDMCTRIIGLQGVNTSIDGFEDRHCTTKYLLMN